MTKLNPPKDEKKVAKNAEPTRERKYLDAQLEKEKEGSYFSTSLATTLRYTRTRILRERKKRANKQLPAGKPKEEKKPINPGEAQTKDGLVSRKPTLYDAVAGKSIFIQILNFILFTHSRSCRRQRPRSTRPRKRLRLASFS